MDVFEKPVTTSNAIVLKAIKAPTVEYNPLQVVEPRTSSVTDVIFKEDQNSVPQMNLGSRFTYELTPKSYPALGEVFIDVTLSASTAGNYREYVGAHLVRRVQVTNGAGTVYFDGPIVPSFEASCQLYDKEWDRRQFADYFGASTAVATAQDLRFPLPVPWSSLYAGNIKRGYLPTASLKHSIFITVEMATMSEIQDGAVALTGAVLSNQFLDVQYASASSELNRNEKGESIITNPLFDRFEMPVLEFVDVPVTDLVAKSGIVNLNGVLGAFAYFNYRLITKADYDDGRRINAPDVALPDVFHLRSEGKYLIRNYDPSVARFEQRLTRNRFQFNLPEKSSAVYAVCPVRLPYTILFNDRFVPPNVIPSGVLSSATVHELHIQQDGTIPANTYALCTVARIAMLRIKNNELLIDKFYN